MKKDKLNKAAFLFCELSGVEDRYLAEALAPVEKRTVKRFIPHRWMLAAACLTLCLVVGLTLLPRKNGDAPNSDILQTQAPVQSPEQSSPWKLDTLLADTGRISATRVEKDAFDFFTGECRVVWQYEGEAHFYMSRPLSEQECEALHKKASASAPKLSSDGEEPNIRIWIVEADGSVWTPYLRYASGNFSAADFFDYHAEVIPSDDLVSCVSDLIFK